MLTFHLKSENPQDESDGEKRDQKGNPMIGYLNLFANAIDNFTHGLAVAASFIVGNKVSLKSG